MKKVQGVVIDAQNTNIFENVEDIANIEQTGIDKLSKDIKRASATLSRAEVRFLVDYYYQLQHDRIRAKNQFRALSESHEPSEVIVWLSDNTAVLEKQIALALRKYAESQFISRWSMSITGIGHIISAGLLAHIDMEKALNPGHIFAFAGMLPESRDWLAKSEAIAKYRRIVGGAKFLDEGLVLTINREYGKSPEAICQALLQTRPLHFHEALTELNGLPVDDKLRKYLTSRPHNAKLKTLLWKVGESFVKVSNRDADFYGRIYRQNKEVMVEKNERGEFAEAAAQSLKIKKYSKDTEAYKAYIVGKLPSAHIHARAKRKAVQMFVCHWWEVAYRYTFPERQCPKPYAISELGHIGYVPIPNNPFEN
jgi:hypothetical protein